MIDTSVIISAILGNPNAAPARVLKAMLRNKFDIYSSDDAIKELQYVLFSEKVMNYFESTPEFLVLTFLLINSIAKRVKPNIKLDMCRDPQDNMFLEIAYESKAEYVITLDNDLLDLRDESKEISIFSHHVKILRPDEFISEISE